MTDAFYIIRVRVYFRSDPDGNTYRKNIRITGNTILTYPDSDVFPTTECNRSAVDEVLPLAADFHCNPSIYASVIYVDQTLPYHGSVYTFHVSEVYIYALPNQDVCDSGMFTDIS